MMCSVAAETQELAALQVIDRLEVGPAHLEARRITCEYTVTANGHSESFDFCFKYDQDVFDPDTFDNLADMVAAQVAINYGLFCKEIIFSGRFDRHDRRFIVDMAENTSREIYVKKFLEPNPFIKSEFGKLLPIKQENYLQASIRFSNEKEVASSSNHHWPARHDRCAVLSSGGKESLLSYGLLNEIGCDVHPIFINESGRHWFTAINAFRNFSKTDSRTARVWTNADRVFNWMLTHLPFIRPDYLDVRADIYPIRLWTVAVFVFGALPLLGKKGIGRLVIGNEFDTTVKKSHEGISHFDGLYDQSRYFDEALSRYFRSKGWGIAQFSVARPLSELLIEKILSSRYPELLKLQTSCHAAHLVDERALPCGKCEKCRRIVGMLTALEVDPELCGYSNAQIEQCLRTLEDKGNHQDKPDVQHLGHMLYALRLISHPKIGSVSAKPRPEVMQLRFDSQRSPLNGIPSDLRGPLWSLMLNHADGAVLKQGRLWMETDPISPDLLHQPYPFEGVPMKIENKNSANNGFLLEQLTWQEAQQRFKEVDLALLPVGAIEQHGPHLPLDTDTYDANYLAREVALACTAPKPIVLPAIPYGVSYHHEDFSGTISVSNETLAKFVYEVGMSCARNGITKLVIINGHGGNGPTLHFAAQMINRDAHIFTCVDSGETSDADIDAMIDTPNDAHAGEIETSTTLAIRPELVKKTKAKKSIPRFSSRYLDFSSKRSVGWYGRTAKITTSGVMGDPTKATVEKGKRMWEVMIRNLTEFVEQLKEMSLDEIYQKDKY